MATPQVNTQGMYFEDPQKFVNKLILLKLDSVSNEMDKLTDRISSIENNETVENSIYNTLFSTDNRQRKHKIKTENIGIAKDTIDDCKKIVDRAIELLSDWCETEDIKLQIQYAAVITGKIDNLKKTDYIQSNDAYKKICTLLKNVIRINVADTVFSAKHISLLKKGFLLLLSEQVQKKDMFQLNREFLEQNLLTMPSWE